MYVGGYGAAQLYIEKFSPIHGKLVEISREV
jgi:hypothetical protein